jgi:hypothetical protein
MGLLDNYTGIGMSPRPNWRHQQVMAHLYANIHQELWKQGLELLTESTVTDNWNDLAPDLVIFNNQNKPLSIIEITTHKECSAIKRKCYELIARFPDSEYFVYDYEAEILYIYEAVNMQWYSSLNYDIYSHYLKMPLLNYLEY